jgi:hypothetical protein
MADDTFDERFQPLNPPTPDPKEALRGAMAPPPPPPAEPKPSPYDARIEEEQRKSEEHIHKSEQYQDREAAEMERHAAEMAPLRRRMMERLEQPLPEHPHYRELPPTPEVNTQGAQMWITAAMLLGSLAGAFTRNHATNALAAMQGALDGYAQGNQQVFSNKMKIWEAESKRAIDTNANALADYRGILEDRKMSIEQMSIELQIAAQQHNDQAMATAARAKNELVWAQLYDQRAKAEQQLKDHATALSEKEQTMTETHRHNVAMENRPAGGLRPGTTPSLSPEAVDQAARLFLAGNPAAMRGIRAGSPDVGAVRNRIAELAAEMHISPEQITKLQTRFTGEQSYQRTAGSMGARVEMATNEVVQLTPQALEATRMLPRGNITPINKLLQEGLKLHIPLLSEDWPLVLGQKDIGDPRYNDAAISLWSLATAYGRAMNPQGVPRVTERHAADAMGLFAAANSQPALETQMYRVLTEIISSKTATDKTRGIDPASDPQIQEIRDTIQRYGLRPGSAYPPTENRGIFSTPGKPTAPAAPPSGKGDRLSALPDGWQAEEVA